MKKKTTSLLHRTVLTLAVVISLLLFSAAFSQVPSSIPNDRLIDWSEAGVPGGIPSRETVFAVIDSTAYGNGLVDATPAIQSAIDACPEGQVVYIPAGNYRLNSRILITKGIVLRGAGPSKTILQTYAEWHGVQVGDFPSPPVGIDILNNPRKGDDRIVLANKSILQVGDFIVIDQINDGVEVINVDDQSRDNNTRCLSQMTRVTAVQGATIKIHPPLYHDYDRKLNPQVYRVKGGSNMTVYAGIEDLGIKRVSPTGTEGFSNIKFVAAAYSWVKNVESTLAQFRHVDLDRSFRNTIRDSYFNDGMHHNIGGFAYGVVCGNRATDNLIENNIFYHLRHSMVIKEGAAGNVFGYNYSLASYQGENWLAADMNAHGAHSHMNLFEGNKGAKIYADFTHGSSSYNMFLRNHSQRVSSALNNTNALRAVDVEKVQYYYSFFGNVLGSAGQTWTAFEDNGTRSGNGRYVYTWGYPSDGAGTSTDGESKTTALRHGNFDYFSQTVIWDSTIVDQSIPGSLYLKSKPVWFGDLPWPAIGPDVEGYVTLIPAEERYILLSAKPPVINSMLAKSGVTCSAFSYLITAANNPTSFSAFPLPEGLSIDTSTGLITGLPSTTGTTDVTITASNALGTDTATLTISIGTTISIFEPTETPSIHAVDDPGPLEIGVRFKSDVSGVITGIRFYKGQTNTGTHIGNLWTAEGVNLASATFSGESESGWQQVDFIVPVPIEANTTYVASYFAPSGNYAATGQGLAEGRDNAPLHALSDGVNGVYVYGPSSAFPVNTFNATNYWVDVVFDCNSTVLNSPLSMSGVNLYPNPANREIRVAMRQTMAKGSIVRVYDSRGIEVLNQEITGEENTLDVSGFLPGLYVLKVYDANGMISSRLFFVRH
ncbi:MAG TPA: DUF4082 domain-containing protein [Cyclobacteriaceae bacterium]|nr:DUF4082 domain-containing protein [Cyclobacteriaceae bacterium]